MQQKRSLVKELTLNLVLTYKHCSENFNYSDKQQFKRILTEPGIPVEESSNDNVEGNLIVSVNDLLKNQYLVKDKLGTGTFGQVFRCIDLENGNSKVAIKIIKNKPAYYKQALVEVNILEHLNSEVDTDDLGHIVRLLSRFLWKNHLCLVFELLSINLYELLKQNRFRGLSSNLVRVFCKQILEALHVLEKQKIIHCDLKPENVLLTEYV